MPKLTNSNRAYSAAKVPAITAMFWVIKIVTTGMGEAASDFLAAVNILLAGVVGLGGFYWALRNQLKAPEYVARTYWSAVAMVAVFGTMAADGVHVVLGVPYPISTAFYALVTAAIFVAWYRSEGTLSIHSINTRRRELFYWATVLATFALGTAAGDLTAASLHLGFFSSGLIFAGAIIVPLIAWRLGVNPVVAFWTAYVLTRPLGASFADWFGKPHSFAGGLGVGDGVVTVVTSAAIVVLVWGVARRERAGRSGLRPTRSVNRAAQRSAVG